MLRKDVLCLTQGCSFFAQKVHKSISKYSSIFKISYFNKQMVFLDFIASVMMKMRLSQRLEKLKTRLTGHFGSSISFNSLKNMKLNELRITNCSRKPEVSVERISLKNYRSLVCTFCHCMP